MSDTDTNTDAEGVIARPSGGLARADRERLRHEAEATLALSPQSCLGPGSIYRTPVPVWRKYLHPTRDDRGTGWEQERRPSKLISEPALGRSPSRARSTGTPGKTE